VGLLLLRTAAGLMALVEGVFYLSDNGKSTPAGWFAGLLGLAAGGALLTGLLTPIAALLAGAGTMAIGFAILPAPMRNLFDSKLLVVLTAVVAAAILLVGPGAFSMDARLFGRREIIIPPRRPPRPSA
jgi:uncharacterized membrane protein YphA (DoxX/SURF4 family)